MGCNGSKSTETKSQAAPAAAPKETKAPAKEPAKEPEKKDEEPWASKERTIAYIMDQLNISEDAANKIYDRCNKDGDKDMDPEEVKTLMGMIEEANKDIKPLFEEADANKSGKVTLTEASRICKQIYPNMMTSTLKKLFKKFDDGDGIVRYGEFIVFYYYLKEAYEKFRTQFEKCDANNTGTVTLTEAAAVLQEAFPKLDERAIKRLLYRYDSGDAIVQYGEFILFYANLTSARSGLSRKFDAMEKDDEGRVKRDDVIALIASETGMDEDDCKAMVLAEDDDNSGCLSKAEFLELWSNLIC